MVYWLIALACLFIVGGMFSILPSPKERAVGKLRLQARQKNLAISIEYIHDVNAPASERVSAGGIRVEPKKRCASWAMEFVNETDEDYPEWTLYKSIRENGPIANAHLVLAESSSLTLEREYWKQIEEILRLSPPTWVALVCNSNSVKWLGHERLETGAEEYIDQMLLFLNRLIELNRLVVASSKQFL